MVVYETGLLLWVKKPLTPDATVKKVHAMDALAKKIASKYGGRYDGNGVGFGEIHEFINFKNSASATVAARGIYSLVGTIEGCPKSISYEISNPNVDDPNKRGKTRPPLKKKTTKRRN